MNLSISLPKITDLYTVFGFFPKELDSFASKINKVIEWTWREMNNVNQIDQLHRIKERSVEIMQSIQAASHLEKDSQITEGISKVVLILSNLIGLTTIKLIIPQNEKALNNIITRFYLDKKHPMDLQKFLQNEKVAPKVGTILQNLVIIRTNVHPLLRQVTIIAPNAFNGFLSNFVQRLLAQMSIATRNTNLLGLQTIEANVTLIREKQENYYTSVGISKTLIENELSFSTPHEKKAIYLHPKEKRSEMGSSLFLRKENEVLLVVPDAEGRVVSISPQGYQILEKLQCKIAQDMVQVMMKLNIIFTPIGCIVTGRTKATQGILDKSGRICKDTQQMTSKKYLGTTDINDVCGCRITCPSPDKIFEAIHILKREGFEFLELDNKYNTIRKDGAHKAIHCTLKDPKTGLIFELQIITLTSITVGDLVHNVIYKKEAIGLDPTKEELQSVLSIQRLGAITETASFIKNEIKLIEPMDAKIISLAVSILNALVGIKNSEGQEEQPVTLPAKL